MRILGRDKKGKKVWITVPDYPLPPNFNSKIGIGLNLAVSSTSGSL